MKLISAEAAKRLGRIAGTLIILAAVSGYAAERASQVGNSNGVPKEKLPPATNFVLWPKESRPAGFRNMDKIFVTAKVAHGPSITPLPVAETPLVVRYQEGEREKSVDDFMADNFTAGLLVLYQDRIVLERYGLGLNKDGAWTSNSVAKSLTSTLVAAAIKDGAITSVDDLITKYVRELRHTAWDGVTIRHALTMSTGVAYNEQYSAKGDGGQIMGPAALGGGKPEGTDLIQFLAASPREAPPGTKFNYASSVARLLGIVVANATGRKLNDYLSEKIWQPAGMEHDASWIIDQSGRVMSSCCLNASLRDFARFGRFFIRGAMHNGQSVLPAGWVAEATRSAVATGWDDVGYGYQWWINPDGSYRAIGIFGQMIYLDPKRDLVIVTLSSWPEAEWDAGYDRQDRLVRAIVNAVDSRR